MHLRKSRIALTGSTNLEYRSQIFQRPEEISRTEFLASSQNKKIQDFFQKKRSLNIPDPLTDTKALYFQNSKSLFPHTVIGNKRYAHLQDQKKRARVFNGDSNTLYSEKLQEQQQQLSQQMKEKYQKKTTKENLDIKKDQLIVAKHDTFSSSIAETQLVGLKENEETMIGQINIQKVKEFRRALRRRYANRKNFAQIFQEWDQDHTGNITVKNMYDMLKNMGMNINIRQTQVLLASADQNQSGDLTMDQFMDLIFNDNDALNVNLQTINQESKLFDDQANQGDEMKEKLNMDAKEQFFQRHQNQLSLILKNQLSSLRTWLSQADDMDCGNINRQRFQNSLKKCGIPQTIMSTQDIKNLMNEFQYDQYNVDYKKFVKHLQSFQFLPEEIKLIENENEKKRTAIQKQMMKFEEKQSDRMVVIFDAVSENPHHLQIIRNQFRRVKRVLSRYIPNKADFDNFLMEQYKMKDNAELNQKQINQSEIIKLFQNLFLSVGEKEIRQRDLQGFLSVFPYNQYNTTPIKDLSKVIFEESEQDWYQLIQRKINQPPPPQEKALSNDLNQNEGSQNWELMPQEEKRGKIRTILGQIENHVFQSTQKAYDVFKEFDQDKDGYVSHFDFKEHLEKTNQFNKGEINLLLKYVDPQEKGFVNFKQFSAKIRPGLLDNDDQGFQTTIPTVYPSYQQTIFQKYESMPSLQAFKNDFVKSLSSSEITKLEPMTRFGASPKYIPTSINFYATPISSLFISEQDRFNRDRDHRIQFQKESQNMQKMRETVKLERIKDINQNINDKIEQQYNESITKYNNQCHAKGLATKIYEHRCHLLNDWK